MKDIKTALRWIEKKAPEGVNFYSYDILCDYFHDTIYTAEGVHVAIDLKLNADMIPALNKFDKLLRDYCRRQSVAYSWHSYGAGWYYDLMTPEVYAARDLYWRETRRVNDLFYTDREQWPEEYRRTGDRLKTALKEV